jgi:hypothetical protein
LFFQLKSGTRHLTFGSLFQFVFDEIRTDPAIPVIPPSLSLIRRLSPLPPPLPPPQQLLLPPPPPPG